MRKIFSAFVAVTVFALGIGGTLAYSQSAVVDVPFKFKVGNSELPPGPYKIAQVDRNSNMLTVRNVATGDSAVVAFLTRLSPREGDRSIIVFDKVGTKSFLSEVYLPGIDGYHLQGAPGKHTHVKVK